MCDCVSQCTPRRRRVPRKPREFNLLFLDCWQREYDERPYRNFQFSLLEFEERLRRPFHPINDFAVIINFLHSRELDAVHITGIKATSKLELEKSFANGLMNLQFLELKLMELPDNLFSQLLANVGKMQLKELILEGSKLSYFALVDIRLYLIESKHLQNLNVNSCDIDQHNFIIPADGVHKSTSMRRFSFNRLLGNDMSLDTEKLSHTISSLIWQNKLTELEMQKCNLNAHDMEIIAEYLWNKCSVLRKLIVAMNTIGSDGAEHLFRAISHSGTLQHLDISRCSLGTHGGDVVAKYLSSCFQLVSLNIQYNGIGASAINNLLTMLKKKVNELSLKIYGNHFDTRSGKTLNRLFEARVLPHDSIDVTVTKDEGSEDFRVVPYY